MSYLETFRPRNVLALPLAKQGDWRLKRYAILADGKNFDQAVASSATAEAINRLPKAGDLSDEATNHGVGFQIIHFAEVAVVSPVFLWQWGSVLANIDQLRSPWENPTSFDDGKAEVIGCIWEMEIVCFEVQAWRDTILGLGENHGDRLEEYLSRQMA
ncbi:hypothetical protein [uncultured Planktomarina sp.]|mgnify:FL=1|jgi:hypothetical protein|uniref:hypothetical protein n=1 Tax=uncultured Planktomarina sp. TaxID=1538529 RepID=UPI000E821834|nr:hypothetical protein [Planktomarina temperata]HAV59431.1 hypothetical protein [Planktomarina temperata]